MLKPLLISFSNSSGYRAFKQALNNPEETQKNSLRSVLTNLQQTKNYAHFGLGNVHDYKSFVSKVPTTNYDFWRDQILEQKSTGEQIVCQDISRYQPTSGSTSSQKWIPYSQGFLKELNNASSAWIGDMVKRFPAGFAGKQYWSLSWIPKDRRQDRPGNDDLDLLPFWQRWIVASMMAVPQWVANSETMDESQYASLCFLVASQNLTLMSVWSPTFLLQFEEKLQLWRHRIAETLAAGEWPPEYKDLQKHPCPKNIKQSEILSSSLSGKELFKALWPSLGLISCWDSAGSAQWANEIREQHPGVPVQGKSLWATECVVTIPFEDHYPVAIRSHFYEFRDLDTQKIHPVWELREGQYVQPLISGSHGLLRYELNDGLKVTKSLQNTPCLMFTGRLRETDLVGEKLSPTLALEAMKSVFSETKVQPISLLAIRTKREKPYYLAIVPQSNVHSAVIAEALDKALSKIFHYKLARELGQLGQPQIRAEKDPDAYYCRIFERKGMLAGDIKIEPLTEITEELIP